MSPADNRTATCTPVKSTGFWREGSYPWIHELRFVVEVISIVPAFPMSIPVQLLMLFTAEWTTGARLRRHGGTAADLSTLIASGLIEGRDCAGWSYRLMSTGIAEKYRLMNRTHISR